MDLNEQPDFHVFRFSRGAISSCFPEEVFRDVIATEAFRRLASIHFLGSIDYMLAQRQRDVETRQTRFDHCLAVANLARRFSQLRGVRRGDFENIVVAALLHDIGHAPLSHSLEPAFKTIFELDHHLVGERILRGEVRLGFRLAKALERHGINNFEVMALIAGMGDGAGKDLFSRPINVDTIEGIIRSASYVMRREVVLNPVFVIDALAMLGPGAQDVLDEFWLLKDRVYSKLIQSRKGLIADYLCKRYMEMNSDSFSPSYYYGTEAELKRDHGLLFDVLNDFGRTNRISPAVVRDGEEMTFVRRKFYIDAAIPLRSSADISRRYLQTKTRVTVHINKIGGDDAHSVQPYPSMQSLF